MCRRDEEEPNASCGGANLLDAAGVLFHGDLLCCGLKAKERLYIQAGGLFKARPVLVLWMHLKKGQYIVISFLVFGSASVLEEAGLD